MDYENRTAADPTKASATAPKRPVELRNSLWCVDKSGRVGMIGEINSGTATFNVADKDGKFTEVVQVPVDDLVIAPKASVPKALGFTEQQLADIGHQ